MATLFIFSQLDALDSTLPENIKEAVIIDDQIFFQIVENGVPKGKVKPKSQFLITQLDQFNIPYKINM